MGWLRETGLLKVHTLSPRQVARFPEFRDRWITLAIIHGDTDRTQAELAMDQVYRCMDFAPPRLQLWVENPLQGCMAAYLVKQLCDGLHPSKAQQPWVDHWEQVREKAQRNLGVWNESWDLVWRNLHRQVVQSLGKGSLADPALWSNVEPRIWADIKTRLLVRLWVDETQQQSSRIINPAVIAQIKRQVSAPVAQVVRDQVVESIVAEITHQLTAMAPAPVAAEASDPAEETPPPPLAPVLRMLERASSGGHKAFNLAFYDYLAQVCEIPCEVLSGVWAAAQYCGWYWRFAGVTILTPKPLQLHLHQGALHQEGHPAIVYPGDFNVYALQGVYFPSTQGQAAPQEWQPLWLLEEAPLARKSVILNTLGFEATCQALDNHCLQEEGAYALWAFSHPQGPETLKVLVEKHEDEKHAEEEQILRMTPVPPYIDTVNQALQWRPEVRDL
jgi:hypothetical protein